MFISGQFIGPQDQNKHLPVITKTWLGIGQDPGMHKACGGQRIWTESRDGEDKQGGHQAGRQGPFLGEEEEKENMAAKEDAGLCGSQIVTLKSDMTP